MDAIVSHYMSPELVYLREGDRPEIAMRPILEFGTTAVPVLDEERRPVGVVSLRDLADERKEGQRVSTRVLTIGKDETIRVAARKLADNDARHLVVVDEAGRAVGMLSLLDVVRALLGMDPKHPAEIAQFGHGDPLKLASRL
jgi:CBS domain-containing protein